MKSECCGKYRHYQCPEYCVLMDEIVKPADCCGMCDCGDDTQ